MTTAMRQLQEIDALMLKQWIDKHEALLLDVREQDEFAQEHIPGAELMPLSTFDPLSIPQPPNKQVVLQCKSGKRSAKAAQKMFEAGFKHVIHLQGGLLAWKAAGYPTYISEDTSIKPHRVVSIVLGSLILLSTGLGPLVLPSGLLISTLVGASLLLFGCLDT
ncbi:Inner membrane protein YgaP [Acaryochloris thomasi RCC1774]|uniref:Inner membrane protein YgaP n=1 Tax=Acaryochloris thomasi RCC1774 TaxID=1764569 RepID=A0A2W1JPG0_9CYAN|nr:rhodanese-like domain-containing protein [Acaryochloris thomasi]PZD71131.1 Inner membrane protein YgaP [Acaryochloris thomasi RCC1774]